MFMCKRFDEMSWLNFRGVTKIGHSIFVHSRSSISELFYLFYYIYSLNIGKIMPLKHHVIMSENVCIT